MTTTQQTNNDTIFMLPLDNLQIMPPGAASAAHPAPASAEVTTGGGLIGALMGMINWVTSMWSGNRPAQQGSLGQQSVAVPPPSGNAQSAAPSLALGNSWVTYLGSQSMVPPAQQGAQSVAAAPSPNAQPGAAMLPPYNAWTNNIGSQSTVPSPPNANSNPTLAIAVAENNMIQALLNRDPQSAAGYLTAVSNNVVQRYDPGAAQNNRTGAAGMQQWNAARVEQIMGTQLGNHGTVEQCLRSNNPHLQHTAACYVAALAGQEQCQRMGSSQGAAVFAQHARRIQQGAVLQVPLETLQQMSLVRQMGNISGLNLTHAGANGVVPAGGPNVPNPNGQQVNLTPGLN